MDEHKPHNGKGHRRRLRKMYQVSESEVEGEDDDRCLISSLYKTKSGTRNTTEEVEEKVDKRAVDTTTSNETEDGVFNATETMNDADDVDVDGQLKRYLSCLIRPWKLVEKIDLFPSVEYMFIVLVPN